MAVSRIVAGLSVVAAGVATALAAGALPALGTPPEPYSATPASAGQRLICPGAVLTVGTSAAATLATTGSPTRTSGTDGSGAVTAVRLAGGAVTGSAKGSPRLLTAPTLADAGAIAGAQQQVIATGDAQGLAAAACTAPTATTWLAAGSTTTGRTSLLTVANPAAVDAQVTVRAWTDAGAADTTDSLSVPARGRVAVPVASIAPNAAGLVLEVVSTGGQVAAALEQQTVRGLEPGGVDITGPTVAPTTSAIVTGVRVRNSAAVAQASAEQGYADVLPVVRVLAPGGAGGTVRVRAVAADGTTAPTISRPIVGGAVTDLTLAGLTDGTWTVSVEADVPVVAGVRISTIDASGDATSSSADLGEASRHLDLAWFAADQALGGSAAVAVGTAPGAELVLANPTGQTVEATASGSTSGGVRVPAGATAVLPASRGVVHLTGVGGLVAAVDYAGPGALAGYPVAPADQTAHAVRVSH